MNEQMNIIKDYLEKSYSGAKMMNDAEGMLRISRALVALQADVYEDIFKEEFVEKYLINVLQDAKKEAEEFRKWDR